MLDLWHFFGILARPVGKSTVLVIFELNSTMPLQAFALPFSYWFTWLPHGKESFPLIHF